MKRVSFLILLALRGIAAPQVFAADPSDPTFSTRVAPVLKEYCTPCHGGDKPKGDLDLASLPPEFAQNADAW